MPSVHVRVPHVGDATGLCTAYVENREFLAPWEPLRDDEFFTVKGQRTRFERGSGEIRDGTGYSCVIEVEQSANNMLRSLRRRAGWSATDISRDIP
jgi:hypothetical protein